MHQPKISQSQDIDLSQNFYNLTKVLSGLKQGQSQYNWLDFIHLWGVDIPIKEMDVKTVLWRYCLLDCILGSEYQNALNYPYG